MRLLALAAVLVAGVISPAAADELTPVERQRLLAHLEMTEGWLVGEVTGLSKAQLTFKVTPDSWSITDVVEHLAIAEPQYWQRVQDSMKQPPTTEKLEATDAGIMWSRTASSPTRPRRSRRSARCGPRCPTTRRLRRTSSGSASCSKATWTSTSGS